MTYTLVDVIGAGLLGMGIGIMIVSRLRKPKG